MSEVGQNGEFIYYEEYTLFKVGDKVKLNSLGRNQEEFWNYKNSIFIVLYQRGQLLRVQLDFCYLRQYKNIGVFHTRSEYFEPLNPVCPVCEQKVEVENNKIKEHKHNNELCYGSYMPCSE